MTSNDDNCVEYAITFKGATLAWAILKGHKKIENRTFRIPTKKWIAIHVGKGVINQDYRNRIESGDMPSEKELMREWSSSIVGCMMIKEHRVVGDTGNDCWATGPVCNVIERVVEFAPILDVKGKLSIWKLESSLRTTIQNKMDQCNPLVNDLSGYPPFRSITRKPRFTDKLPESIKITKVFSPIEADSIFEYLKTLPYQYHKEYMRFNKIVKVPRGQASFTFSESIHYSYKAAGGSPPNTIADCRMKEIITRVNDKLGTNFNTCLMNVYEDGDDCIGFHRDDETGWVQGTGFATIAFGVTRDLQIKSDHMRTMNLPHMKGYCIHFCHPANDIYQHAIPKRKRVNSKRISLTLREIRV